MWVESYSTKQIALIYEFYLPHFTSDSSPFLFRNSLAFLEQLWATCGCLEDVSIISDSFSAFPLVGCLVSVHNSSWSVDNNNGTLIFLFYFKFSKNVI